MSNVLLRMWRRIYRIPLIFLWALWFGFYSLFFVLPRKDRVKLMAQLTQKWGKGLARLFSMELHIHGDVEKYKQTGGLVVSNHLGYLDVFVHAAAFGLRFTPKKEIRSWPVFGWYTSLAQVIWIDRTSPRKSKETLEQFRETLQNKIPLIVYPEGTSTDGYSGLLHFKTTSFEAVANTNIPVQPVLTFYRWNEKKDINPAWFGDVLFAPHLWQVLGNGKIVCHLYLLDLYYPPAGADRKQLANEVYEIMNKEYQLRLTEITEKGNLSK